MANNFNLILRHFSHSGILPSAHKKPPAGG
jgi:hypothetical protein